MESRAEHNWPQKIRVLDNNASVSHRTVSFEKRNSIFGRGCGFPIYRNAITFTDQRLRIFSHHLHRERLYFRGNGGKMKRYVVNSNKLFVTQSRSNTKWQQLHSFSHSKMCSNCRLGHVGGEEWHCFQSHDRFRAHVLSLQMDEETPKYVSISTNKQFDSMVRDSQSLIFNRSRFKVYEKTVQIWQLTNPEKSLEWQFDSNYSAPIEFVNFWEYACQFVLWYSF